MNKRFVYFLVGALLTGIVLIAWQASATTPNPGHPLTCTIVTCTVPCAGNCTATCTSGTLTGGGLQIDNPLNEGSGHHMDYPIGNSWYCSTDTVGNYTGYCKAVCCDAG